MAPAKPASSAPSEQLASSNRRALLKAAWISPLIVAMNLPRSGYAANISDGQFSQPHANNGNHYGQRK